MGRDVTPRYWPSMSRVERALLRGVCVVIGVYIGDYIAGFIF